MRGRIWYPMLLVLFLAPMAMAEEYASPQLERAIESACMVATGDGSRGSGCVYGYDEQGRGLVVTAQHVITGNRTATVYVGRELVRVPCEIAMQNRSADVAVLRFNRADWPHGKPLPRGVPIAPADWRVPEGHPVYSVGYPGAVRPALLLVARARGYSQSGMLAFHPGPELGRSGSAVFTHDADDNVVIVGVISVRNTSSMRRDTIGYAATPAQFRKTGLRVTGYPTQCGPMGCPVPGGQTQIPGMGDYRLLPYRHNQDERIEQIERQSREQSPGTMPLPPVAPAVDLAPINARIDAMNDKIEQVVNRSNEHSEAIAKLAATAEKAVALADMVAQRDEAFGRDLAAVRDKAEQLAPHIDAAERAAISASQQAAKAEQAAGAAASKADAVEGEVAEQLDADNPRSLLGRVRDRIEARVEERIGGLKDTLSGMVGLPTILGGSGLGIGGIAIVIALVALLRRGAIAASQGDPTLTQRLAARTSNPYDDMAADVAARVLGAIGDRLPSQRGRTTKTAKK